MNTELTDFLHRNNSGSDLVARLEALGVETLERAWDKASPGDLVWAVTRPGVMAPEQRRLFLVFVLESIEDKLTDPRSKNILEKLRTKSPITRADAEAADAAARAAEAAAAADDAAEAYAADAASWAADDARASASWAAEAAAYASWAASADTYAEEEAEEEAREQQARWIRTNLKLADLRTN